MRLGARVTLLVIRGLELVEPGILSMNGLSVNSVFHWMLTAQRLKRVFAIDVEVCPHCGGGVRIIACTEDPVVIRQILSLVEAKQTCNRQQAGDLPPSRAPPPFGLFG